MLGDKFEIVTAFSREGSKKVYVQHRLKEMAKVVNELLEQKAYFYVCGDAANMAREVNTVLAQIMAEQRGIPESKAEDIVKSMRASNQYQVRPPRAFVSCAGSCVLPSSPASSARASSTRRLHLLTPFVGGRLVMRCRGLIRDECRRAVGLDRNKANFASRCMRTSLGIEKGVGEGFALRVLLVLPLGRLPT